MGRIRYLFVYSTNNRKLESAAAEMSLGKADVLELDIRLSIAAVLNWAHFIGCISFYAKRTLAGLRWLCRLFARQTAKA